MQSAAMSLQGYGRRMARVARAASTLRRADVRRFAEMVRLIRVYQRMHDSRPLPELVEAFDSDEGTADEVADLKRITSQIDLLMRIVYRDRYCMKRSLLHFHYMRRLGLDVSLQFGVAKTPDGLTGHAWIELSGLPYAERFDPRDQFARTWSFPPVKDPVSSGGPD